MWNGHRPWPFTDMKIGKWTRTTWPYNPEVTTETWSIRVGRGTVYLRTEEHWPYCCSFGANSDGSYSGCLFGHDVPDIEAAKAMVLEKVLKALAR